MKFIHRIQPFNFRKRLYRGGIITREINHIVEVRLNPFGNAYFRSLVDCFEYLNRATGINYHILEEVRNLFKAVII
jgi:hypothetical protein